ncbi:hypothetical protein HOLleu_01255 [Holothuria leucospilota]|uniref:Uncharacterized protein n=1 Tax=Holothuria leucospilota TaxID=206669 RepID=A0A9Q1HGB1_HOLLE|nr:hypothetical protein HOLleu_01255 [Holothuria leucospilota]
MAGFGSDGASVMVGCRNGVATQLKRMEPMIVSTHCVAHRLALAVGQVEKDMPVVKRFNAAL